MQENVSFSEKIISNYFKFIFKKIPFFISLFGRGSIAFCEKTTKKNKDFFIVDIFKKRVFFNEGFLEKCHTIIHVNPGVLNSAMAQKNLNSLGISKLLDIHTSNTKKYSLFFLLCVSAEIGSNPFYINKTIFPFFQNLDKKMERDHRLFINNI